MKYISISNVCALLTASVSGFVPPSSSSLVSPVKSVGIAHEIGFCSTVPTRRGKVCSLVKAAQEDSLDVFIDDMLKISTFVYTFRTIRNIVKSNDGKTIKRRTGLFSSEGNAIYCPFITWDYL